MAWTLLCVAGLFEICWAIGLKYTEGFTRPWPTVGTLVAMGTGYAVWTGIGAAGTAVLGMVLFAETASAIKVLSLLCIVLGIIGLRSTS